MAPLPSPTVAMAERLLTGEALALAEVELVILVGAAGVGVEPLVALVDDLPGDVPLMFFVASFTSWNFSMNYFNQQNISKRLTKKLSCVIHSDSSTHILRHQNILGSIFINSKKKKDYYF